MCWSSHHLLASAAAADVAREHAGLAALAVLVVASVDVHVLFGSRGFFYQRKQSLPYFSASQVVGHFSDVLIAGLIMGAQVHVPVDAVEDSPGVWEGQGEGD
jgi:hypothetical protein